MSFVVSMFLEIPILLQCNYGMKSPEYIYIYVHVYKVTLADHLVLCAELSPVEKGYEVVVLIPTSRKPMLLFRPRGSWYYVFCSLIIQEAHDGVDEQNPASSW